MSSIEKKGKKIKILHIEDVSSDAVLVNNQLKKSKLDYEILVVDTKAEFIKELKINTPDIILADHSLPSFNSHEALIIINETDLKIPFILVTATMSDELAVDLIRKGADDYILKDRLNRLPAAIQNALETCRLKRAKEAIIDELISSQLHLKEAQAVAKLGSWETDLQTFSVIWSEEHHHIFETDPKTFQATHEAFYNFIHPEDRDKVKTTFENSFNSQTPNSIEHRIITTNGTLKHVIENWKVLRDAQGHPVRAIGTCQDITERKIAETDLLESREEMQTVFNASLDAIIIIDEEGKITKWDAKAELLFGWKEEEVIGTLLSDNIIPPGLREAHKQGMKHFLKTGKGPILNKTIEVKALKKDKTEINISLSISPTRAKNKYQFIGFVRDISERKVVEEALQKSESNLQAIFENTSDGFILADINGIIKSFNSKARDRIRFNIEKEINIGKSIFDFLPNSKIKMYKDNILKILSGKILQFDYPYTRKSGETKWFSFTINPVYNAEKIEGICITSTDITERKKAENKLNATSKELETAVAGLKKILDSSIDVICSINSNGEFVNVSAASQKVWGYTPEEVIGSKFMNLVYDEDADITSKAAEKIISGTQVPIFENRYVHKSGRVVPMLWSVNWDEKLQLMFCIAKDVTEKKRLEKAVETERDQFFEMFLKAPSAIGMLKGADYVFEMANPLYLQLIGKKDIIGKTVAEVLPEVIEQGFIDLLDNVYRTGETYIGTETLVKIDKEGNGELTDFYMNFVYQAYRNGKGEIEGVFFFINDIIEQQKAKENLLTTSERLLLATTSAKMGIWDWDVVNNNLIWDKTMYSIFGVAEDKFSGAYEAWAATVHPDDIERAGKEVNDAITGISDFNSEFRVIWPDKSVHFIEAHAIVSRDEAGVGVRMIGVNIDITERKKADEENRFKANLLNTIGQAAIATDLDGVVNYWNKAAEDIYGWTSEEVIGKDIVHLMPAHTAREQALKIMEDLKKGRTWSGEFRVQRKDGTDFPALVSNSPIYDENNILSGIIGISSDITEKKKLEDLLDKSDRLARIGSWEYNIITQTHFWSQITREIYEVKDDLTPDLQTGISYYKSGESRLSISKAIDNALKDGTPWDLELQIVTAEGNELWVRDIGEAEFLNGMCIRLYGSFQDIDARKKAEIETLKAYEEKNIILESIGDAFFAVDKEWKVTYWNKQAEKMLLTPKNIIIGNNLWEIFSDSIDSESYKKYHEAIEKNEVINFEDYYAALDKWFAVSAYPSVTGLSVFFKDITDRKLADIELSALNLKLTKHANDLAASNRELEDFAYVASHDLQEPLRMVTGFLGQIEKKYSDVIDDKGKQYIHFAVDGAKRMRQIILDLIEFSRIGRTVDTENYTDLNDVVLEVLSLCQKQIKETKAIIRFKNLPSLVTHQTALRQVFQNLISNALKYHVRGKTPVINISTEETETHWQFAISDNGIGIEAEYFNKIFVIFQRLHNKNEYSGTGIGLAVCKKIIENFGGKIWLESEEDKGSTFYFTIPKK